MSTKRPKIRCGLLLLQFLAALCLLAFALKTSHAASWESTGGPLGGLGYDVRINPLNKNTMYVTDNWAGVAKSDNAGQSWYQSNSGITIKGGPSGDAINIFSLTLDPNNPAIIWAGTFGEGQSFGVFKSADAGADWTEKTNGITLGSDTALVFRGFTVQKGNSNIVYAQAEVPTEVQGWEFNRVKGRVYKTEDGGESWKLIWQGDNLARYLIIDPTNSNVLYLSTGIFDREAYNSDCANGVSGGLGVLKSYDGGSTWTPVNSGLTDLYVGSLRMHPTNAQILFAATGNNACSGIYTGNMVSGLFKTANGGTTWTKVIDEDIFTTVNFSPSNPEVVYVGTALAFYRSGDGGTVWSSFSRGYVWGPQGVRAGFPIDVTIDPDNSSLLYVNSYGGGVFRSSDGAATWEIWSKGYSGADMHKVRIPANKPAAVYAIGRSGPYVSSNRGSDWSGLANGDAATYPEWYAIEVHPSNSEIILMSDEHQGVIFRSTDSGKNFSEVFRHPRADASNPDSRQGVKTIAFSPSDPAIVYAGLSKDRRTFLSSSPIGTVIYKSSDGGAGFSPMSSVIDGHNVNKLVVDSDNSDILYAAATNGVYKSADGAKNWTKFTNLGDKQIEAIAVKSGYIVAGELFGGIWISSDDGSSWTGPHNSGFSSANPYISAIEFDPSDSNVVYAGDTYSGIYKSTDKGANWSPFPDSGMSGLTVRAVTDLAINAGVIYAATQGGGVFRYDPVSSAGMSVPAGQEVYALYNPIEQAVKSAYPAEAKPVGVGPVSTGGNTMKLHIGLNQFTGPVDIYFGVAAQTNPSDIYILKADDATFQPVSSGLVPWRENTTGPLDVYLFGSVPTASLPTATYTLYLLVTPAGSLNSYYLWSTYLVVSP